MQKIPGKEIAQRVLDRLRSQKAPEKILAAIQVGTDEATAKFVERKRKAAEDVGVNFRTYRLPASFSQDELRKEVGRIAAQKSVGGVLVQLPLPEGVNKFYVLNAIPPRKDIDVLSERSLGSFYNRRGPVLPPAAGAVQEIWRSLGRKEEIEKAAIVGPGFLIGQPVATWLIGKAKEISIIDEGGRMEAAYAADLIISGVGSPGIIDGRKVKSGAVVLDFGYGQSDGKILGDFLPPAEGDNPAGFYTPTPGGTGPVLVAKLIENFFILNSELR
ncbi:MAG: bifunctional 5,10-methylenetetrahydrofolate dehydrogenase/5,10-methenyltetrahydrofolate cyclohydrolase [Patescibacteria group bacterium]|nr:bifunctional 5,10-methylenetetrahydrofolate dehydrogenase/5,10-methenyltetrahydrofolate cyclohydrolase [Patescibacteria group bacterium]